MRLKYTTMMTLKTLPITAALSFLLFFILSFPERMWVNYVYNVINLFKANYDQDDIFKWIVNIAATLLIANLPLIVTRRLDQRKVRSSIRSEIIHILSNLKSTISHVEEANASMIRGFTSVNIPNGYIYVGNASNISLMKNPEAVIAFYNDLSELKTSFDDYEKYRDQGYRFRSPSGQAVGLIKAVRLSGQKALYENLPHSKWRTPAIYEELKDYDIHIVVQASWLSKIRSLITMISSKEH